MHNLSWIRNTFNRLLIRCCWGIDKRQIMVQELYFLQAIAYGFLSPEWDMLIFSIKTYFLRNFVKSGTPWWPMAMHVPIVPTYHIRTYGFIIGTGCLYYMAIYNICWNIKGLSKIMGRTNCCALWLSCYHHRVNNIKAYDGRM